MWKRSSHPPFEAEAGATAAAAARIGRSEVPFDLENNLEIFSKEERRSSNVEFRRNLIDVRRRRYHRFRSVLVPRVQAFADEP